jgi:hypothetical protein
VTPAPTRCRHALRLQQCPTCSTRKLVHDLLAAADWLASSVMPGTGRSWQPPAQYEDTRTPEQREQARMERLQRVDIAPGETPPLMNLDVMDLLTEVLVEADRLSVQAVEDVEVALVEWAGAWARDVPSMRLPDAATALADPAPYLHLLDELIEHISDPDLVEHIADRCHRLVDRANKTLGLFVDGQLLDAQCPWCGGKTERHPEGGRRTLRIRMSLPPSDDSRAVIVCEGGRCEPGANSGERWKGLPAWDLLNEGEWLGTCIRLKDEAATCRCGLPVLRSGKPGRPAQHCSEECRRAADADRQRAQRASA